MARMPGARWLGEHSPGTAMSRYDIVCLHTIVGFAPAHAAHFSVHHDGTIDQSRDTKFRSGANLEGNHRVIAIENEDHGSAFGNWNTNDGHAVPAFTAAQIEANAKILAWAHKTHGIPLQLCPNSRSTSRGLAYHRQGIDGNFSSYTYPGRVSGGEIWTKSFGKVCPGDRRISARDRILARAKQIVSGTTPPQEDEVELTDTIALKSDSQVQWSAPTTTVKGAFESLLYFTLLNRNLNLQQGAAIKALAAAVAAATNDADITEARMVEIVTKAVEDAVIDVQVTVRDDVAPPTP